MDFVSFEQNQPSCFHLFPFFILSYVTFLLDTAYPVTCKKRVVSISKSNCKLAAMHI